MSRATAPACDKCGRWDRSPVRGHTFGTKNRYSKGNGHPVLFKFEEAADYKTFPDGGGYPIGFLEKAYKTLGVTRPDEVLHLCSGSMRRGVRVDIRHTMSPTVVADVTALPFKSESFRWIMADPPYGETYAESLYGVGKHYPKPGRIVREALRVLKPGGRFGLLHFMVPMGVRPLELVGVWGITTGSGYAIRAWTVFEKPEATMFEPRP